MRDDCPRTASPPDCLDDNLVAGFVEGGLSSAERSRVERLIDQCAVCRRQVSEVMRVRSTMASGDPATSPGRPPEQIGRYEVRATLGQGGMGVVLRAWDPQLERDVAVKLVRGSSADGALRLVREARAMAKLRHPHVITVHDAGILAGEVFVVMELVDGEDLAAWYGKKPSWQDALERCKQAGAGLAAAHAAGLVHRDFKPQNVLCGRDGRVLVADFGLARGQPGVSDAASALTGTGVVVGTPAYMAPEQHLGEAVGPAADQFALAATIYEGLYGARPFGGNTLAALISEVVSGKARPPPATSDVPRTIAAVVMRGLAREPRDRWPSVQAMLDALAAAPSMKVAGKRQIPLGGAIAAIGAGVAATVAVTLAITGGSGAKKPAAATAAPPDAARAPAAAPAGPAKLSPDELAHWDILGHLSELTARARAWAPDAELAILNATDGRDDGTLDLGVADATVQYIFFSPARTANSDLGSCYHQFSVERGAFVEFAPTTWDCDSMQAAPAPRCTIAYVREHGIAQGLDAAKPISLMYDARNGWSAYQKQPKKGFYVPDACGDYAHWDVMRDEDQIGAKARAWAPDAHLMSIVAFAVQPDGIVDLTAGGFVSYSYVSFTLADSNDPRTMGRCTFDSYIKDGSLYAGAGTNTACNDGTIHAPGRASCTFVDIWKRAEADGADPAKPAKIEYGLPTMEAPLPRWLFEQKGFVKQYRDDC